jgi:hypothetical protein
MQVKWRYEAHSPIGFVAMLGIGKDYHQVLVIVLEPLRRAEEILSTG